MQGETYMMEWGYLKLQTGGQMAAVVAVRRSFQRYTKFLIVGLMNALVDLVVLNLLLYLYPTQSDFWLSTYNTLGVVCAIVNSYVWNRYWTFSDVSKGTGAERAKFVGQAILNIALNDAILVTAAQYLTDRALPLFVSSNLAKAAAMLVSSTITYTILRLFVFTKPR